MSDEPVETEPGVEDSFEEISGSLREGFRWARVAGLTRPMSDVAFSHGHDGPIGVVALDGEVFLSATGGASWVSILPRLGGPLGELSDDEQRMLDLESRIEDALEQVETEEDLEDAEEELEEIAELERAALEHAADDARGLMERSWSDEQERVLAGELVSARPRIWFVQGGGIAVGRADGLHLSEDEGESWDIVLDVPVTALLALPERGLWLAGTADGVRFSTDLVRWIDVEDETQGLHIFDLVSSGDGAWAGTDSGVWFAPDAQTWSAVGTSGEAVVAVRSDPDWDGGVWFSTTDDVWRSDDGLVSVLDNVRAPIPGVLDVELLGRGRLMVASADGPWESRDGGLTFQPVVVGLGDPDCRALARRGGQLLLASDEGLFQLVPIRATESVPVADIEQESVPLEIIMDAALQRAGVRHQRPSTPLSRLATMALPRLVVEASYDMIDDALVYHLSSGTSHDVAGEFRVSATLTWRPEAPRQTDTMFMYLGRGEGGPVRINDENATGVLLARTERRSAEHRLQIAGVVSHLYYSRLELHRQRALVEREAMIEQVELELRINEIEAHLDAYTDQAFTRWHVMNMGRKE